jgi:hypothetical protein
MSIRSILVVFALLVSSSVQTQPTGVSLEEFTGAWCGWCPYGAWVLDSVEERLGDRAVVLAWHYDDKFEKRAFDTISARVWDGGHPTLSINRTTVIGNAPLEFSESHPWLTRTLEYFEIDPAATPAINNIQYDPTSRGLVFMPTLTPIIPDWPHGGVPMAVAILTEDDVKLDQTLYSPSGGQLPKLLDYPHQNVVRQVAGKVLGDSLHFAWGAGWYFMGYSMAVDPKWDASKTRLNVLFVVRNEDGSYTSICAVKTRYLTELNTMSVENRNDVDVNVYPNPAGEKITIDINDNDAVIELYNALGQRMLSQRIQSGSSIDVSQLARGMYSAVINAQGSITRYSLVLQ